jgi:hypothetical protein
MESMYGCGHGCGQDSVKASYGSDVSDTGVSDTGVSDIGCRYKMGTLTRSLPDGGFIVGSSIVRACEFSVALGIDVTQSRIMVDFYGIWAVWDMGWLR